MHMRMLEKRWRQLTVMENLSYWTCIGFGKIKLTQKVYNLRKKINIKNKMQ